MDVRLLGPVEASVDGRVVAVSAGKPRALLALLSLHAGSTVSSDRLIDGLWGERPPATAAKLVQRHVSQLRKALSAVGDGKEILTRGHGYELRLGPDDLDVTRFERLVAVGRPREALALWRGPALDDVAGEPFAAAEIRRLEELRLAAVELAIDRDLAAGRHREVVGELERLVLEEPLREKLHAQRMLALYCSGRQADALEAYRHARTALAEQIGVEPGPELRRLHEAILRQDPSLEPAATAPVERAPELDTSTPLVGREAELNRLREHWRGARDGAGRLVLIAGACGIGKTRLAAELAAEIPGDGGAVLYASGAGTPAQALRSARAERRPALLVIDDADRAGAALRAALADELAALPLLVLATAEDAAFATGLSAAATLTLAPLDADGVRAVARLHAGAREDVEVPVERLVQASGGVPRQLHRAAGEWARTLAVRRLGEAARRLAAERPVLRAAEDDLAGNVFELHAAREGVHVPAGGVVVCPFKGLASFDVDDAEFFFGRERLIAEMVARLTGAPLTGIVGASGSGKSSALRAGLLAALAGGVLPGSERWPVALLRPGEHPMEALERAASDAGTQGRLIVAVDQFEEVFTACRDERERAAFADALTACARDPRRRALVLVAIRADFYGRCAEYPELSRLLGASHVLVGPMRRDELRRAIELPARRAGLEVEPDLVDALLADIEGEPGALPLLSTALLELWQHRDGRRLRMDAYEHAGGVHGAVARLAEHAYERLDPERRQVARRILLRLAGEGEGEAAVRRRVPLSELGGEGVADVLAVLAHDRLVTIGEGEVEVAHEALLREWPRLRGWLDEDREGRRTHRRLIQAVREWSDGGRDRADLYRGARLASALEWCAEHEPELNATEHEFLAASRAAGERVRRRVRLAFTGVLALLVVATSAALIALDQRGRARDQARAAEAQGLGARALSEQRLDRSLLLARQGVALDDALVRRDSLLAALRRSPAAIAVMSGDGDGLSAIALHPDGRTLAVGDEDGTVMFLDAVTRRRLGRPHEVASTVRSRITSLAFSPDGARLASAAWDPSGAFVDLFDGRTRRHITRVAAMPTAAEASVHFSPDSRVLAAQDPDADRISSAIWRWDGRTGTGRALPQSEASVGRSSTLLGLVDSGTRLVTTSEDDRATVIRDAATLRPLRRFAAFGSTATMSSAAGLIALGARDGSVRLLDLHTGELRTARGRHEAPVVAMRFDPVGERLVTAGDDERLIVWDPVRATAVETLEARGIGLVQDLEVASDGRTAYSAGRDGTVIAWDLTGERRWERPFGADGTPQVSESMTTSARGSHLAVIDAGDFVDLFESRTLRRSGRIRAVRGQITGAAVSPDGRTLAITTHDGMDGALELWDTRTRRPLGEPQPAHAHPASALTFSADGRWLATGGIDPIVRLWDVRRRTAAGSAVLGNVSDLSLSPDGTMLAAALQTSVSGGLQILSVPALEPIRTLARPIGTVGRFSPDGRSLIYGDRYGRVWTLDTTTWRARGRPLDAGAPIRTADLSPDGRLLATTSTDGTGRLWDVASGRPIGATLSGVSGDPIGAAFIRGGSHLAVLHKRGGVAWDVRPSSWTRHACAVVGRTPTRSEWENALPQHSYAPACARR